MEIVLHRDILKSKSFSFNGTPSFIYGLICSGNKTYGAPKRRFSTVSVPGRNGDVITDDDTYDNIELVYEKVGFIGRDDSWGNEKELERRLTKIRTWLLGTPGYCRIEDSWHPEEFRMGYISDGFDPEMLAGLNGGYVNIKFNCMPQRFIKSGDRWSVLHSGDKFVNIYGVKAYPEFYIKGNGTIVLAHDGGKPQQSVIVSGAPSVGTSYISCDEMNCWATDGGNRNNNATFNSGSYWDRLYLDGTTTITYSGFSEINIKPHWWRL